MRQEAINFWYQDGKFLEKRNAENSRPTLRFWVYKGEIYTNDYPGSFKIVLAKESERAKTSPSMIHAALSDLKDKDDGVWYFGQQPEASKIGWYCKPLPNNFEIALNVEQ
jgi:hypothetical protein